MHAARPVKAPPSPSLSSSCIAILLCGYWPRARGGAGAELELHVWHKALYTEDPRAPESVKLNPLLQGVSSHVLSRLVQKFQVKELAPNEVRVRAPPRAPPIAVDIEFLSWIRDPNANITPPPPSVALFCCGSCQ